MKASTLRNAVDLITNLDNIEFDLQQIAKTEADVVIIRLGTSPQLKYKPATNLYKEFLETRKKSIIQILSQLGVNISE